MRSRFLSIASFAVLVAACAALPPAAVAAESARPADAVHAAPPIDSVVTRMAASFTSVSLVQELAAVRSLRSVRVEVRSAVDTAAIAPARETRDSANDITANRTLATFDDFALCTMADTSRSLDSALLATPRLNRPLRQPPSAPGTPSTPSTSAIIALTRFRLQ